MGHNDYKHILHADDDTGDAMLLEEAIEISNPACEIFHVENGAKVIDYVKAEQVPDLFILDLNMPIMNGMECIKKLKLNHSLKNIPILVFSTSGNPCDIKVCFSLGADYYIIKPDTLDGMLEIGKSIAAGNIKSSVSI